MVRSVSSIAIISAACTQPGALEPPPLATGKAEVETGPGTPRKLLIVRDVSGNHRRVAYTRAPTENETSVHEVSHEVVVTAIEEFAGPMLVDLVQFPLPEGDDRNTAGFASQAEPLKARLVSSDPSRGAFGSSDLLDILAKVEAGTVSRELQEERDDVCVRHVIVVSDGEVDSGLPDASGRDVNGFLRSLGHEHVRVYVAGVLPRFPQSQDQTLDGAEPLREPAWSALFARLTAWAHSAGTARKECRTEPDGVGHFDSARACFFTLETLPELIAEINAELADPEGSCLTF